MSIDSLEKIVEESSHPWPHIEVRLELSDTKYESERQVYTFFTMIGDIGGFNSAIIILPAFLMTQYSDRMYTAAIQEEIPRRETRKRKREQPLARVEQWTLSGS